MIAPGSLLGLLGGGQLGRMFTMAAQSMGYQVMVLDPGDRSPAGSVADEHLRADYLDRDALRKMASRCAAATTEFENVPAESLDFLAQHAIVSPSARAVAIAQDRIREKTFLAESGLDVAPFAVVASEPDLDDARLAPLLPGILKIARLGYDGKGQVRVTTPDDVRAAFASLGRNPCVLEKFLSLECEVSVVVARAFDDSVATFPVAENRHAQGILDVSIVPARIPSELAEAARKAAIQVAEQLDYRGVLCVEFFVVGGGRLVVNEIAPRPHNSGHYTIDACVTSQFEQQARVLCSLPLGDTSMHCPAVMVNLLGDLWAAGEPRWEHVLRNGRTKLHLYGKTEARPGRKMGHYTVLAEDVEQALATATEIKTMLVASRRRAEPSAWRKQEKSFLEVQQPVLETRLKSLLLLHRGKVRDLYEIDAERMLIIQTDRLSAFDVILPTPIPGKGRLLTEMSNFWFTKLGHVIPNHLLDVAPESVVAAGERGQVEGRAFVVRRLKALPIEAIVRGYIAGSGWKDYQKTGMICGIALPAGMKEAQKLPQPIFTPSTKAAVGTHDENIPFAVMENQIGAALAAQVRDKAVQLYSEAADYARARGIIIADTKFEFGLDKAGTLYLIDEALTPDSSRFWPQSSYQVGMSPPSFDKQFVRDWLEAQNWNKTPPAPALPADVAKKTGEKYEEALRLLTA